MLLVFKFFPEEEDADVVQIHAKPYFFPAVQGGPCCGMLRGVVGRKDNDDAPFSKQWIVFLESGRPVSRVFQVYKQEVGRWVLLHLCGFKTFGLQACWCSIVVACHGDEGFLISVAVG